MRRIDVATTAAAPPTAPTAAPTGPTTAPAPAPTIAPDKVRSARTVPQADTPAAIASTANALSFMVKISIRPP